MDGQSGGCRRRGRRHIRSIQQWWCMDGVRGLTRRTLRTLRLRYPPPPLPPYILLILLLFYFHFIVHTYFHPPIGSSVGPYHIHVFILRFIFNYRTISIYIISRTFYSLS